MRLADRRVFPLALAVDGGSVEQAAGDVDLEIVSPDSAYFGRRHSETLLRVIAQMIARDRFERWPHVVV